MGAQRMIEGARFYSFCFAITKISSLVEGLFHDLVYFRRNDIFDFYFLSCIHDPELVSE